MKTYVSQLTCFASDLFPYFLFMVHYVMVILYIRFTSGQPTYHGQLIYCTQLASGNNSKKTLYCMYILYNTYVCMYSLYRQSASQS